MEKVKGQSINRYLVDYCVLDLETTGVNTQKDKIIEIGALKVRDGVVIDSFESLVNPHKTISAEASLKNHITDDMVKEAPDIEVILDSFLNFIGDDVVIGANLASFDIPLLNNECISIYNCHFTNDFVDVLQLAKIIPGLNHYNLETIANHFHVDTEGNHRALKDCHITKECFDHLYKEYGENLFYSQNGNSSKSNSKTKRRNKDPELEELQLMVKILIINGINSDQMKSIQRWIDSHPKQQKNYFCQSVLKSVNKYLSEGELNDRQTEEIKDELIRAINPVDYYNVTTPLTSIDGKHICITGDFEYGSADEMYQLIENADGINDKGFKKTETEVLVIGALGSPDWLLDYYGGKMVKALETLDKGRSVEIRKEEDFIPYILDIIKKDDYLDFSKGYYYTGEAEPSNREKRVRRAIKLPVTKQLVYYPDKNDQESKVNILRYKVVEQYKKGDQWFIIEIETETGDIIKIHSDFLIEMQKPSFITDLQNETISE